LRGRQPPPDRGFPRRVGPRDLKIHPTNLQESLQLERLTSDGCLPQRHPSSPHRPCSPHSASLCAFSRTSSAIPPQSQSFLPPPAAGAPRGLTFSNARLRSMSPPAPGVAVAASSPTSLASPLFEPSSCTSTSPPQPRPSLPARDPPQPRFADLFAKEASSPPSSPLYCRSARAWLCPRPPSGTLFPTLHAAFLALRPLPSPGSLTARPLLHPCPVLRPGEVVGAAGLRGDGARRKLSFTAHSSPRQRVSAFPTSAATAPCRFRRKTPPRGMWANLPGRWWSQVGGG